MRNTSKFAQLYVKEIPCIFLFLISCNLTFSLMNIDLDQGIYNEKTKIARNEKQKNYVDFLIHKI